MRVLWGIVLWCALPILVCNTVLYRWRAKVLRRAAACDVPERLGRLDATWAFVKECAALAAVVLLIPIGWCLPRRREGTGSRGPVILLHGWGVNSGSLWMLQRRLLYDGWSPVCCVDYRTFRADVERAAHQLRDMIEGIQPPASDGKPIMLIGHGLGGLVLRYYLRRYPAPSLLRRIVTLGTPHSGTAVARLLGRAAAGLVPGSPLLSKLNAADRVPQQFDVIAIHSTFDALILPPQNAQYPGAFNIQVNDVGHHALLFSSKVYRLLVENLAAPL